MSKMNPTRSSKKKKLSTVCRVCLHEGDVPIFGNEYLNNISAELSLLTGLDIKQDDDFPKFLCHSCHEQLQSAILFRQTAQETDLILKEPKQDTDGSDFEEVYLDIDIDFCDEEEEDSTKVKFKETLEDEDTSFYCRKCDQFFVDSNEYGKHMLTDEHQNVIDECPFCLRSFKCIKTHLSCHKKYRTVICEICDTKFLYPTYVQHSEIHTDHLKFECTVCPYRGRTMNDLKLHNRKHTGERPYQCSECPAGFISKSNLNRHMQIHKTDYKVFCSVCDKGYFHQRDLDVHMNSHTGVRPHRCNICNKTFSYRKGLMRHTLNIHKREKMMTGRMPNYLKLQSQKSS